MVVSVLFPPRPLGVQSTRLGICQVLRKCVFLQFSLSPGSPATSRSSSADSYTILASTRPGPAPGPGKKNSPGVGAGSGRGGLCQEPWRDGAGQKAGRAGKLCVSTGVPPHPTSIKTSSGLTVRSARKCKVLSQPQGCRGVPSSPSDPPGTPQAPHLAS